MHIYSCSHSSHLSLNPNPFSNVDWLYNTLYYLKQEFGS